MDLLKICKTIDNIYETMYVYKALLVYDDKEEGYIHKIIDILRIRDYPVTLDNNDMNARLYCVPLGNINIWNDDTMNQTVMNQTRNYKMKDDTINLIMCLSSYTFHNIVNSLKSSKVQFQDRLFVIKI